MGLKRVEIEGDAADTHRAVGVCLAKAITTAYGGGVSGQLFVPRETFDLFNHVENRCRMLTKAGGVRIWQKDVQVQGVPYVSVHLTTMEPPS